MQGYVHTSSAAVASLRWLAFIFRRENEFFKDMKDGHSTLNSLHSCENKPGKHLG